MKLRQLFEDGRIVKGVNTTVDVGPDEIKTQAAKFGNTVDKDGRPPTLSKKVKGSSTNVLYNLGLAESKNHNCPRTLASSCQCESIYSVTESQDTITAVCVLEHSDEVKGTLLLKQIAGGPTLVVGKITGLEPGEHGFHIHEFGDMSKGCESMGGHYNPDGVDHGDLEQGHIGDLGNIVADDSGTADIEIIAKRVDLSGERSVVGRGIVVHADEDDLGKGGDEESLKTGNAGDRLACGVILLKETVNENFADGKKKGKSTNVLFNLGLTEGTDKIPVKAGHVLFSDWAKDHIAEHNEPGIGSVFSSNVNIDQLAKIIETLPVQGQGGPYTTKVPGIGYNLVLPYEEAKALPNAQEATVEKQERGQKFDAPAFKTSAPISQFKTDILTLIIVPSNPQYLPDDVKQDKEILNSIQRKESYSIVTAFPGDPDIPPVSQWNNRYAVVIPDQQTSSFAEALGEIANTTHIYVDMDGVLADFFTEWGKLMGKDDWRDIGQENIPAALEKIKQTENFWLDLPLTKNAKNLLNLIKDVKGEYSICSSPLPGDPNSEPHKLEWIKKHLNFFPPKEVIITHDKPKYATQKDGTPNILIDDYGKNISAWEAAGGVGFKHKDHKFERTAKDIKQHMQEPVEENFADGKKKGKSRPGRVKRAGASCNGSVTALRKRAKNASGEKAKMYHWCANMKSGRKKK